MSDRSTTIRVNHRWGNVMSNLNSGAFGSRKPKAPSHSRTIDDEHCTTNIILAENAVNLHNINFTISGAEITPAEKKWANELMDMGLLPSQVRVNNELVWVSKEVDIVMLMMHHSLPSEEIKAAVVQIEQSRDESHRRWL